jgi:hypothetical protein
MNRVGKEERLEIRLARMCGDMQRPQKTS